MTSLTRPAACVKHAEQQTTSHNRPSNLRLVPAPALNSIVKPASSVVIRKLLAARSGAIKPSEPSNGRSTLGAVPTPVVTGKFLAAPSATVNPSEASNRPAKLRTACVVDLDNICNRKNVRGKPAWAHLDVVAIIAAMCEQGVSRGTVFQNRHPKEASVKLWAAGGLKCVGIGENVDPWVIDAALNYTRGGFNRLLLVASDGGYAEVIHAVRRCGIRVELWALRAAVAKHLVFAADVVRWIDHLVREPIFDGPGNGAQGEACLRNAA